jgi:hypothetical protein
MRKNPRPESDAVIAIVYFKDGRFVAVTAVRGGQVLLIAGDKAVA